MSSTLNYRLELHRVEINLTSCNLQVDAEHFNKHRLAYICALTALATFLISTSTQFYKMFWQPQLILPTFNPDILFYSRIHKLYSLFLICWGSGKLPS